MQDCKNVLYSCCSYRRNIKDVPFVKRLSDTELAVGVTRSLSEIFTDEFEFKSLKNVSLNECQKLKAQNIITEELINNKDISAYGKSYDDKAFVYANEQEHIRIVSRLAGNNLEECYKIVNQLDDKVLNKLEMAFDINYGYLTQNPKLVGTGLEVEVLMFLPALNHSDKLKTLLKDYHKEYEFLNLERGDYTFKSPFVIIKNKYTFGHKENQIAARLQTIVDRLIELEKKEEDSLFNLSASTIVDKIFKSYGLALCSYRQTFAEFEGYLTDIMWGDILNILKASRVDYLQFLNNNKTENFEGINLKEQEKMRAKNFFNFLNQNISKGEVDV
ncbi:MAG: hypothetical protein E7378_04515 [Clostridiales bacterium]|nr:hypothetical protein [Clostridiales bacterium]